MKNRRLGRGLDFLLSTPAPATDSTESVEEVEIDSVHANPWQPRSHFDEQALEELTASIRRHGLVQPILVRPRPSGGYELVAGERRFQAARRAGLARLPATIRAVPDGEMLQLALIENVHRRDLNPVEKARAYRRLIDEQSITHQQLAKVLGISRSSVSNTLRLLDLEDEMLLAVAGGQLTEGHARALLAEGDPDRRKELFERAVEGDLTVRRAEQEVSSSADDQKRPRARKSGEARRLEKKLREALATEVEIQERGKKGKIVIHYGDLEAFDRLFRLLARESPDV